MSKVAILGGTGIDELASFSSSLELDNNKYGSVYYREDDNIVFLPRHSKSHSVPPHMINYRANIECLRKLGVESVISIYAVGSITDKLKPLEWTVVDDFIDFSSYPVSFFAGGEEGVRHVDMSNPFDAGLQKRITSLCDKKDRVVYISTSGPRLETKAEINAFRIIGADVVGMTLAKEATLLKEAGIKNASIAYSINWAAGVCDKVEFVSDDKIKALTSSIVDIALKVLMEYK